MSVALGSFRCTDEERYRLTLAIEHNCTCDPTKPAYDCPAHLILHDEALIKRMIFVSRDAELYTRREFK
jgi:hypothetical protein